MYVFMCVCLCTYTNGMDAEGSKQESMSQITHAVTPETREVYQRATNQLKKNMTDFMREMDGVQDNDRYVCMYVGMCVCFLCTYTASYAYLCMYTCMLSDYMREMDGVHDNGRYVYVCMYVCMYVCACVWFCV
jgi:hypothetical protein